MLIRCLIISVLLILAGCQVKKRIAQNEKLYDGASLILKSKTVIVGKRKLKQELDELMRPKPNTKLLGARFYLWLHYKANKERSGKIWKKLNKKYGEKPVYFSSVDTNKTIKLLYNRLENRGFFFNSISTEIKIHKKTVRVDYTVVLSKPYTLESYVFMKDSSDMSKLIEESIEKTILKPGVRYDLELLKKERQRIDSYLKDRGYIDFRSDNLLFKVDTNQLEDRNFQLYLFVKKDAPLATLTPYKIQSVKVYADYSVTENQSIIKADSIVQDSITFIQGEKYFKPWHLSDYIMIRPNTKYSLRSQNNTSSRLSTIGTFKYVTIHFTKADSAALDSSGFGRLDAEIFLSTYKNQAFRIELQGLSKSNNFVGPELLLNYRNKSIFNAGELLTLTAKVGYEAQFVSGKNTGLYSIGYGLQADLIFPRMASVFNFRKANTYSVPKTKFSISYDVLDRVQYYKLTSVLGSFGYIWNTSPFITHEVNPISVNYVQLRNITDDFRAILAKNPYLVNSFQQQFIAGVTYSFQYNQLVDKLRRNSLFFRLNTDFSGNTIDAVQQLAGNTDSVKTVFGEAYAQYAKADGDIRLYKKLRKESVIIMRLFAGMGVPYRNSSQMPFIKQYYSGGPNSIRAFRVRSIGPGSYATNKSYAESYWDQSGNIKLEANLEYRFPIISVLKGAWFVDAGNVWLSAPNESLPGGTFTPSWYTEVAIGAGFGVRIDIDFFVIRFDLATPIRNPGLPQAERWTGFLDLKNGWNPRYLVLNFAIGYPF